MRRSNRLRHKWLRKTVETYIKEHWDRIAKVLAGTYAPNAYSEDFPTEVLRKRFTAIVADNVIKLYFDKKRYRMLFDIFILPRLMKGSTGGEELHNVLNRAMQTMQVDEIAKIARRNSDDKDFSKKSSRAKKDHIKRFGHSRSDTKMINYSELEDPESEISFLDTIADDMVLEATGLGIASCITARAEETFDNDFGSELLKKWGIPENFIARAFVLLGYCEGEYPQSKPRRDGRVVIVDED